MSRRLAYKPALDGVRGAAVAIVLLFHAGFVWARGGFLGVTVFFVLSGFLITSLLLVERDGSGSVSLRSFWERRARRLVPGVLVLVAVVICYEAFGLRNPGRGVLGDGMATLTWVANWRFVFAHRSYADLFGGASPFQHMWSLGIEEQFYLALPLVFVGILGVRNRRPRRVAFGAVVVAGIAASTAAAIMLHPSGAEAGRAYYGTDARVAEPLVGVLLALLLVHGGDVRRLGRAWRWVLDAAAVASAAGLWFLIKTLTDHSDRLYAGGFLAAAVLAAVVIAAATQHGLVARLLSAPPLVQLGKISYGVYLYHWPVFLYLSKARTGLRPVPLLAARCAVTLALAVISYVAIERPIRAGRMPGKIGVIAWADISLALAGTLIASTIVVPATGGAIGSSSGLVVGPPPVASAPVSARSLPGPAVTKPVAPATVRTITPSSVTPHPKAARPGAGAATIEGPPGNAPAPLAPPPAVPPGALKVVVVGDSMADALGKGLVTWSSQRHDTVVYDLAVPGCPLSRGGTRRLSTGYQWEIKAECSWWADDTSARKQYFDQFNADVIVMQDGMNEVGDRKLPSWSSYRKPGQPDFDSWLIGEYSAAIKAFAPHGQKVVSLNAVCADWETLAGPFSDYTINSDGDNRVAALDRDGTGLGATGATLGDLQSHLCPGGKFTQTVDGVHDARPDGYHLSSEGAAAVAQQWLGPLVLQAAGKTPPRI